MNIPPRRTINSLQNSNIEHNTLTQHPQSQGNDWLLRLSGKAITGSRVCWHRVQFEIEENRREGPFDYPDEYYHSYFPSDLHSK